jgi:predicted N-acetyltransferase YhbS
MTQPLDGYSIVKLDVNGVEETKKLASSMSWSVGLYDSPAFHVIDADGFLAGMIGNVMASCIFGVNYSDDFAFLGRYIVRQEYRGRDYGIRIWEKAIDHISGRPTGLNAALVMQEKYTRYGFRAAQRGARYSTRSRNLSTPTEKIVPLDSIPFADLLTFDRRYHPTERKTFLTEWMKQPEMHKLAVVDDEGTIRAYGVIRHFDIGWKIGPLFSENPKDAESLFDALQNCIPEHELFFVDFSLENANAVALATKKGMVKEFENMRMYSGRIPDFDPSGIYSYTSNELG